MTDLPAEVRAVVERHLYEGCGEKLPLSASPYHLDEGTSVWLCETCAAAASSWAQPNGCGGGGYEEKAKGGERG